MRTITPIDDKQLWRILDLIDGQHYSWPLYATPCHTSDGDCYLIESAIPIDNEPHWNFVNDRISPRAFGSDGPRWLMRRTVFENLAQKCNGVTPRFYFQWGDDAKIPTVNQDAPTVKPEAVMDTDFDQFVRHCCSDNGHITLTQARGFMLTVCAQAPKWLLEMRRTIPLGFCTLRAFPYRENWQGILHAKFPEILAALRKKGEVREGVLEAIGFNKEVYATDLIEMTSEDTFGWSLSATVEEPWRESVEDFERETFRKASSPYKYLTRWSKIISDSYEDILIVFKSWLEKAAQPIGNLDLSLPKNRWRLSPKRNRGRVRPVIPQAVAAHFVTGDSVADHHEARTPEVDESQAEEV